MASDEELLEQLVANVRARQHIDATLEAGPWQPPTPLVDWWQLYGRVDEPADWLVEPIIPRARSVALYAKGGTGKSLLSLSLAAGLATGQGLIGKVPAMDVLYLDYEMTENDLLERLEDMDYCDAEQMKRLHYALLPDLGGLDSQRGGEAVIEMAEHFEVSLVVIDTFGRAVHGEENEADTVRNWYRWTGQRLKARKIAFLRIDHAGKDLERGQRGTSAKNDDVDLVYEMTAMEDRHFRLKAIKRRIGWARDVIDLEQTAETEPLAYVIVDGDVRPFVAGAKECAADLDELGAETNISTRKAQKLLRNHLRARSRRVVVDAVRYRKTEPQVEPPGNHPEPAEEQGGLVGGFSSREPTSPQPAPLPFDEPEFHDPFDVEEET